MMKKWAILPLSVIIVLGCGEEIQALGFGPYFGYEYLTRNLDLKDIEHFYISDEADGIYEDKWEDDISEFGKIWPELGKRDFRGDKFIIGFLMDTAVAHDSLFNYRLSMGFSFVDYEEKHKLFKADGYGFQMKNTFGYCLLQSSSFRLWIGPTLHFFVDSLHKRSSLKSHITVDGDIYTISSEKKHILDVGAGGGVELGLNIHIGNNFSIGITTVYLANYISSIWEYTIFSPPGSISHYKDEETLNGPEHMFFVQLTPIYRFGRDKDE